MFNECSLLIEYPYTCLSCQVTVYFVTRNLSIFPNLDAAQSILTKYTSLLNAKSVEIIKIRQCQVVKQ